jgi:hypothetical protein
VVMCQPETWTTFMTCPRGRRLSLMYHQLGLDGVDFWPACGPAPAAPASSTRRVRRSRWKRPGQPAPIPCADRRPSDCGRCRCSRGCGSAATTRVCGWALLQREDLVRMTRTLTSKPRRAELPVALRPDQVAQVSSQPSMSFCAHNACVTRGRRAQASICPGPVACRRVHAVVRQAPDLSHRLAEEQQRTQKYESNKIHTDCERLPLNTPSE